MNGFPVCPACPAHSAPEPVERHRDPIAGKEYRIVRCLECGVTFSLPREAVGPDWYEKAAPIRDLEARRAPEEDGRFRRFFEERLPPGRLLDVGCGDGGFLVLARARGFEPAGFDYDARVVALARARGIADAESAEFGDYCRRRAAGEFDCITLFDMLEHTPEPGLFLAELKRLLKPGGHVVITLPNARRPVPWRREEHDYPPHHFTRWTPAALRGFLERNGFRVVRQDASDLRVAYLADHLFFYVLMPPLLRLARRLLFGPSEGRGTITELYAAASGSVPEAGRQGPAAPAQGPPPPAPGGVPGSSGAGGGLRARLRALLADKLARQRCANALKSACGLATWPAAAVMTAAYRLGGSQRGDCLYTVARLEAEGPP